MEKNLQFIALVFTCVFGSCLTFTTSFAQTTEELYSQVEKAFDAYRTGDVEQISALRQALANPKLNTQARTALEALPDGQGLPALREGTLLNDRVCVVGCLDSLGKLRDLESVGRVIEIAQNPNLSEIVRCAALKTLGRMATPEAIDVLQSMVSDPSFSLRLAAADGLISAGTILKDAACFKLVREANIDESTTIIALLNEILLTEDAVLFSDLLESDDSSICKIVCIVLTSTDNVEIIDSALAALPAMPFEYKNRVVEALGSSKSDVAAGRLLQILDRQSETGVSQAVLIRALGNFRGDSVFTACFKIFSSEDSSLREAAVDAVSKMDVLSEENASRIEQGISLKASGQDTSIKNVILSCLEVISRREMTDLADSVKLVCLETSDTEIASSALSVWCNLVEPSPDTIESFMTTFNGNKSLSPETLERGLEVLCRRCSDKMGAITVLEKILGEQKPTLARLVGVMGGKYAADYLGDLALRSVSDPSAMSIDAIDEATKALGEWSTADAGDALAKLAFLLPEGRLGKFKTRAIRGYIRIVRQMGELPLAKLQKWSTALRMTQNRPQERGLLDKLDDRFNSKFRERSLFNGKDLNGWEEYEADVFKVEDGAIVGGNFDTGVPHNHFLTTSESFGDFYLRLECKLVVDESNKNNDGNAGVQFRSVRIPDNWEMIGYQADMSSDGMYWGCLYDESRRNRMLQVPDPVLQKALLIPNDWNTYEVLAQGKNVKIFLNGVMTVDYWEDDETVSLQGKIGLQIHAGGPARAYYRNIFICDVSTDDSN